MEEEDPARGDEGGRDHGTPAIGESPSQQGDERKARDRERCRDEAHPSEAEPEMGDSPGEEEVQRCSAALACDVLDHARKAVSADEERKRLVLVWWPGHQLVREERRCRKRDRADREPERVCGDERTQGGDRRRGVARGVSVLSHLASSFSVAGRFPA